MTEQVKAAIDTPQIRAGTRITFEGSIPSLIGSRIQLTAPSVRTIWGSVRSVSSATDLNGCKQTMAAMAYNVGDQQFTCWFDLARSRADRLELVVREVIPAP